jgi:DNA-binding ferritin-like protein (Dps family)
MKNKDNFKSMAKRINAADGDYMALFNLDISLSRLWDVGAFDIQEFKILDTMISDRMIKLES